MKNEALGMKIFSYFCGAKAQSIVIKSSIHYIYNR